MKKRSSRTTGRAVTGKPAKKPAAKKAKAGYLKPRVDAPRRPAKSMAASRVRQHFADTLDLVRVTRGRIIVKNHGTAIAAIVPVEDAELLAAIEDEEDIRIADERLRAFREGKMTVIAAEELYKKLGI